MFRAAKAIMSIAYLLIYLVFFPLFITFLFLLKRHFKSIYYERKIRLLLSFTVFMIVLGFRLVMYNCISFDTFGSIDIESIDAEIPLYISEIFIALCYMKLMVSNARRKKDEEIEKTEEKPLTEKEVLAQALYGNIIEPDE